MDGGKIVHPGHGSELGSEITRDLPGGGTEGCDDMVGAQR